MTTMKSFLVVMAAALALQTVVAEEEKEDAAVTAMNVAMSGTLIASISFIMILYYFTNYPDDDIQKSSWGIVSSTISIFCAVLLFQSFNAVVEEAIIDPLFGPEEASLGALLVDMCHMVLWYSLLQGLLAKLSGALDDDKLNVKFARPYVTDNDITKKAKWEKRKEEQERRELNLNCFAVLMAHLTGFASINAWGTVQQFEFFKQTPLHAFLAVPIAIVGQLILQRISDTIRTRMSIGDDAVESWWEKKWDAETEEAENDVMGLTVSFLTMNAIRSAITGCLPNQEGAEEECKVEEFLYKHSSKDKWLMVALLIACTAVIFAMLFKVELEEEEEEEEICLPPPGHVPRRKSEQEEKEETEERNLQVYNRFKECMVCALSMLFSWAFFYGMQMWLAGISALQGMSELLAVITAMSISIMGFLALIVLDKIADGDSGPVVEKLKKIKLVKADLSAEAFDDKVDRGIRQIMFAIGLTIGFAWEQCFDKSVDAIAEVTEESKVFFINPSSTKIYLAIFCSCLLVPAWRWYILPFVKAEGWQYGWTTNLVQKYCPEEVDESEDFKANAEIKERLEKHVGAIQALVKLSVKKEQIEKERKAGETRESVRQRLIDEADKYDEEVQTMRAGGAPPRAASNESALNKEVVELRNQLNSYRRMFDEHMINMGGNLKKMNETMNKLQAGA